MAGTDVNTYDGVQLRKTVNSERISESVRLLRLVMRDFPETPLAPFPNGGAVTDLLGVAHQLEALSHALDPRGDYPSA